MVIVAARNKSETGTGRPMERRRERRFEMSCPARFYWQTAEGKWCASEGMACNVSRSGAYVTTGELPTMGAVLRLAVRLPSWGKSGARVCLQGSGVVRHIGERAGCDGYGASIAFRLGAEDNPF